MIAYERMRVLIDAECLFCVPSFIRSYLTRRTLEKAEQEHPKLFREFCKDEEPDEEQKEEMRQIINKALSVRISQHFENRAKGE